MTVKKFKGEVSDCLQSLSLIITPDFNSAITSLYLEFDWLQPVTIDISSVMSGIILQIDRKRFRG
ncbi:MAG: hypothetical protein ACOH5I_13110 [Oligoflexus sp.]